MWVARMVRTLGLSVKLCVCFGGETGLIVRTLVQREGVEMVAVEAEVANAAYVHDRRSGEREVIAEMDPAPLSRDELDQLYGAAILEALEADACVLTGTPSPEVVPADMYRRLAEDIRANDIPVVADLSATSSPSAVEGGVDVLKVSHQELLQDGRADDDTQEVLLEAMRSLRTDGAANVVVSRAHDPTLALVDGGILEVTVPPAGAGRPPGRGRFDDRGPCGLRRPSREAGRRPPSRRRRGGPERDPQRAGHR